MTQRRKHPSSRGNHSPRGRRRRPLGESRGAKRRGEGHPP